MRNDSTRGYGEGPIGSAMRPERRRGKNLLWSQNKMSRNYRGRCSIVLFPASPSCLSLFPCSPLLRMTFRKIRCGTKSTAKNHWGDRKMDPFMSTNASERREREREKERTTKKGVSTGCYNKHFLSVGAQRKHLRFLDAAALLSIHRFMLLPCIVEYWLKFHGLL